MTQEKIKVMQAHVEGKTIEYRYLSPFSWNGQWEVVKDPAWNWHSCEYRVKKEPRTFYIVNLCGDLYAFTDKDKALEFMSHYSSPSLIKVVEKCE
jgi:hypothetical protein